jgi:predicted transglutaminase-like cysteine proteinase
LYHCLIPNISFNITNRDFNNFSANGIVFSRAYPVLFTEIFLKNLPNIRIRKTMTVLALFACCLTIVTPEPVYALFGSSDKPKLFGTGERKSSRLKPFPKWLSMLSREKFETLGDLKCKPNLFNECNLEKVSDLAVRLAGKSILEKLKEVNRYMNNSRYLTDPNNWGVADYWETPTEFFNRRGDCEDYAIVKYKTLKRLGIPKEDMRIVVLMDNNLRIHHSVLAVYVGSKIYILDNQIKQVIEDKNIFHYQPIFSINEKHWWRHR